MTLRALTDRNSHIFAFVEDNSALSTAPLPGSAEKGMDAAVSSPPPRAVRSMPAGPSLQVAPGRRHANPLIAGAALVMVASGALTGIATFIAADYYRARTPPAVMHYAEADGR